MQDILFFYNIITYKAPLYISQIFKLQYILHKNKKYTQKYVKINKYIT